MRKPWKYVFSFFGIIDFLAVLPAFIGLIIPGTSPLLTVRFLRLLRLFRVLKITALTEQSKLILDALKASRKKIAVCLFMVSIIIVVFGALMYVVEGSADSGFDNIPRSIYWCVVTITTVGYGDISPSTAFGQFLASVLMLLGYSIIAIPTGIVTAEFVKGGKARKVISTQFCRYCSREGHEPDALYCKYCGEKLNP